MRAGAVANDGTAKNIGDNRRDNPKSIAVVNAVRPVLPPSETPDALSTKVVTVEVPRTAPAVVPIASASKAPFILGSFPSLSSIFAFVETPISVPIVSNISTNKNANMTTKSLSENILLKSNLKNIGAILGTEKPLLKLGNRL